MMLWTLAALAAGMFCLVRAILDFRERRIAWGIAGLIAAGLILLTPIQTHAVVVGL